MLSVVQQSSSDAQIYGGMLQSARGIVPDNRSHEAPSSPAEASTEAGCDRSAISSKSHPPVTARSSLSRLPGPMDSPRSRPRRSATAARYPPKPAPFVCVGLGTRISPTTSPASVTLEDGRSPRGSSARARDLREADEEVAVAEARDRAAVEAEAVVEEYGLEVRAARGSRSPSSCAAPAARARRRPPPVRFAPSIARSRVAIFARFFSSFSSFSRLSRSVCFVAFSPALPFRRLVSFVFLSSSAFSSTCFSARSSSLRSSFFAFFSFLFRVSCAPSSSASRARRRPSRCRRRPPSAPPRRRRPSPSAPAPAAGRSGRGAPPTAAARGACSARPTAQSSARRSRPSRSARPTPTRPRAPRFGQRRRVRELPHERASPPRGRAGT